MDKERASSMYAMAMQMVNIQMNNGKLEIRVKNKDLAQALTLLREAARLDPTNTDISVTLQILDQTCQQMGIDL